MDDLLLKLDGLSLGYKGLPLLEDTSIEIHAGELVLLLGPNGTGKSSFIKGLCSGGELDGNQGRRTKGQDEQGKGNGYFKYGKLVFRDLEGNDLSGPSFKAISEIVGTAIQDPSQFTSWMRAKGYVKSTLNHNYPHLSSAEAVHKEKESILPLFERFFGAKGKEIASRFIASLSGGQRQIVNLVSCFSRIEAPLYILDEPLNNLDTDKIKKLMELVDEVRRRPLKEGGLCPAVLAVTHCRLFENPDRVYVIRDRKLQLVNNYEPSHCLSLSDLNSSEIPCPMLKKD